MKKFYFLAMMAMLAMSTTSCQKDEFNDAPAKSTSTFSTFHTSTSSSSTSSSSTTVLPTPKNTFDYNKVIQGTWNATLNNGTKVTLVVTKSADSFLMDEFKGTLTVGDKTYEGKMDVDAGYVRFYSNETNAKTGNFLMGFSGKWISGNQSFRAELIDHDQSLGATNFAK